MEGLLVAICSAAVLTGSAASGQHVATDYGEALRTARSVGRPLLVVLDSAQQHEERIALPGARSADAPAADGLENYVLCHVDATTRYGQRVAKAFRATELPYAAIIDKTGSVILFRRAGHMRRGEWIGALRRHRDGERHPPELLQGSWSGHASAGDVCFT